jgi:hypothetical protein
MPPPRPSFLERHGRRMARFRWAVIPLFVLLLVVAFPVAGRLGSVTTSETSLPGSEGQRGFELIERHFDDGRETTDLQAVFRHPTATVDDPGYRARVEASLDRAAAVVPGTRVLSYCRPTAATWRAPTAGPPSPRSRSRSRTGMPPTGCPPSARRSARRQAPSRRCSAARRLWATTSTRWSKTT